MSLPSFVFRLFFLTLVSILVPSVLICSVPLPTKHTHFLSKQVGFRHITEAKKDTKKDNKPKTQHNKPKKGLKILKTILWTVVLLAAIASPLLVGILFPKAPVYWVAGFAVFSTFILLLLTLLLIFTSKKERQIYYDLLFAVSLILTFAIVFMFATAPLYFSISAILGIALLFILTLLFLKKAKRR